MSVSRLHAQLARDQDGWLLGDLGSHNGTRVNGWLVREPVPVRAGDVLQFGSATFVIQGQDPEGPENPPQGGQGGQGERGGGRPPR
jgi:pSer/pThr/pTyr-binding forkhead associated (FHA) protein